MNDTNPNSLSALATAAVAAVLTFYLPAAKSQEVWVSTTVECKNWTDARNKRNSINLEHYVQGLLDGFSLGTKVDFWGANEATRVIPSNAFYRMDDYCKTNPKSNVLDGAFKMLKDRQQELARIARDEGKKKR